MDYNRITERHDYNSNGFIGLIEIKLAGTPEKITCQGIELTRKVEFHVSIICVRRIAQLIDPERAAELEQELVTDFLEYQAEHPMVDFSLRHEYYLMKIEDRVTVVGLVDMPSLQPYFDHLRQKYNRELPTQPGHITMYTLDPNGHRGIGILSDAELTQYGEPVVIPELVDVEVAA